jgi:hypothetical protein
LNKFQGCSSAITVADPASDDPSPQLRASLSNDRVMCLFAVGRRPACGAIAALQVSQGYDRDFFSSLALVPHPFAIIRVPHEAR